MKKILVIFILAAGFTLAQNDAFLQQTGGVSTTAAITQLGSNNTVTGHGTGQVQDVQLNWFDAAYQSASGGNNTFTAIQEDASSYHRIITDQTATAGSNTFYASQTNSVRDVLDNTQEAVAHNSVFSEQYGTSGINRVNNWQYGFINYLVVDQNHDAAGQRNFAAVIQNAAGLNVAVLIQQGSNNSLVNSAATGSAYNPADLLYSGYGDGARMTALSGSNDLTVEQTQGNNSAGLNMFATISNIASIVQDGLSDFETAVHQTGANNMAAILQENTGSKVADLVQNGPANNIGVIWQQ